MVVANSTILHTGRWHLLATRLVEWWKHGPRRSDLDSVSSEELARMARDLGISPYDLTRLSNRDADASLLLHERLKSMGLTQDDIEQAGFRPDLERTCGLCDSQEVCRHDLEMRPDDADGWKSYCPNQHSIELIEAQVLQKQRLQKK